MSILEVCISAVLSALTVVIIAGGYAAKADTPLWRTLRYGHPARADTLSVEIYPAAKVVNRPRWQTHCDRQGGYTITGIKSHFNRAWRM